MIRKWLPRKISREIADICGHKTAQNGKIEAFGVETDMKMPRNSQGRLDYCLDCITQMTVKCAWCGDVIFIGTPITLYGPSYPWVFPDGTVFHSDNPLRVVGCPSSSCADTGADYVGMWLPDTEGQGQVVRRRSMYAEAIQKGLSVRTF